MAKSKEIGFLTVYYGPMFSRKTSALIDAMLESRYAHETYQAFKPKIDNRGEGEFTIRSKRKIDPDSNKYIEIPATPIHKAGEILTLLKNGVDVVGIDEGQFLDNDIFPVIHELTHNRRISVVVSGLPTDFRGEPFGPIPGLVVMADEARAFVAICQYVYPDSGDKCGDRKATKTQRIINGKPANWNDPVILIGKEEFYEPRCRFHHVVPGRPY